MTHTSTTWPHGDGEMARRIREYDWETTSLGPIAIWPEHLRACIDLVLDSPVTMSLMWGVNGIQIYNDAYAAQIGMRHPAALGESAFTTFADVRKTFEPLFRRSFAGEAVLVSDIHFQFMWGFPKNDVWCDLAYSPVRDAEGDIAGVLAILTDITDKRVTEDRQAFVLELNDRLRPLTDPADVQAEACRIVGEQFQSDRAYYVEIDEASGLALVERDYVRGQGPSLAGTHPLAPFNAVLESLREGRPFVCDDVADDPKISDNDRPAYIERGLRSFLSVPLIKAGALIGAMSVTMEVPRQWTDGEVDMVQHTVERTWEAMDRARVAEALQRSEAQYRTLFESIDQGFCTIQMLHDDSGVPIDYRVLSTNPAFIRNTGLVNAEGKRMRELEPAHEAFWYATYGRIAETGVPERFESEAAALGRWYSVYAYSVGEPEERRLGVLFEDITARKLAEAELRESEERLRAIIEEAKDYVILSSDSEGIIDSWYRGAEEILGWTEFEAIGQPIDLIFTAEDVAAGIPTLERTTAREKGRSTDMRWHRRKDDSLVFLDGVARARRGPGGEFLGVFKIGQDITERRIAFQQRQEDQERVRQDLARRVRLATAELRALSRRLLVVQEDERRRLALELHDEIGQALTGLGLQLGNASSVDPQLLMDARRTVAGLTEQVRNLSMELRPATLDTHGLLPALRWHLERYQRQTGIAVELRQEGADRRFTPAVEVAAYRIVQEALTNAARHGKAEHAVVQLFADDVALTVNIRDHGLGFDATSTAPGSGLGGMRERAELLGGTFEIDARPGNGVALTVELPLQDDAFDDENGDS